MSQTSAAPLRTTYWVFQIGSKLARSACGTKRSVRAAARCEIAGVARPLATSAPAPAVFKKVRRSIRPPMLFSDSLAHPPEEWQRSLHDATDVSAPRLVHQEETGRRVHHAVERCLVEPTDCGLLLVQGLGLVPSRHLRFDRGHIRPAEPRLVATGAHADGDRRIDAIRPGVPGMEHLPAALTGRRLHGAAGTDRAPVDGGEIHVHAETLEQVGRNIALRLGDRQVLGDQTGDRLTRITRLRK